MRDIHILAWEGGWKGHVHTDPGVEQIGMHKPSFEHGWEKTQEEKQQLSHSPTKPWVYRHTGEHLGIRQCATAPCHGLSLSHAVNTISCTTWSGERQVCKPVLWAPHNMRILSQVNVRILPTIRSSVTKPVSISLLSKCSFQKGERTATSQWGPILIKKTKKNKNHVCCHAPALSPASEVLLRHSCPAHHWQQCLT